MEIEKTSEYQLEKNTDQDSALNFEFLRARGLALIQQYAGTTWTDYNLHDPGVTILEHLCYAITDLAYRTSFHIGDLLTEKDGTIDFDKNLFFLKQDILTTNPVMADDFRKLVIDQVPEIYNIWIEPIISSANRDFIKGLYNVYIQVTNDEIQEEFENKNEEDKQVFRDTIINKVRNILCGARNLGDDYEEISVLEPCDIAVETDIVVDRHMMPEELLAQVYDVLIKTLNPPINFYTETSLREKGIATEDIYQGPSLEHGFILDSEMTDKVSIVDPSDLTKSILSIDGVSYVRKLVVTVNGTEYDHKPFYVETGKFPRFIFDLDAPTIRLFSDNYEVSVKKSIFSSLLHKKLDANKRKFIKGYHDSVDNKDKGVYSNVEVYQSIQNLFPPVYRINIDEIESPRMARSEQDLSVRNNQAKAKQLKAYLMLFEQILANYLSQLGNIGEILSPNLELGKRHHTYFAQPLYDVPGAGNILTDFMTGTNNPNHTDWDFFKADANNGYRQFLESAVESDEVFRERKKKLLDHMLSRFNLNLLKYPLQLFDRLYKLQGTEDKHTELYWKAQVLRNAVSLTKNRNQAYNYAAAWTDTPGGFETLMSTLLYLKAGSRKRLGEEFEKGLGGGKLRVEKNDFRAASPAKKMGIYEVNWDGERIDMQISDEELEQLLAPDQPEPAPEDAILNIKNQGISFLTDGIDQRNYKMGPEINSKGFIVLYRSPKQRQWSRVGKYTTRDEAVGALNSFINMLKAVSIETEGFHLVEHVLLRPSLQTKAFGFNFYDEKGEILLQHNQWYTFDERQKAIKDLLDIVESDHTQQEVIDILEKVCHVNQAFDKAYPRFVPPSHALIPHTLETDNFLRKLNHNLRESLKLGAVLYPSFSNLVKRVDQREIAEDFFKFRMTVVLPAWPARFQDRAFKLFVENLFIENSPAHMKLDFRWLSIAGINQFEDIYFPWMEAMQTGRLSDGSRVQADKLISFLNNETHRVL